MLNFIEGMHPKGPNSVCSFIYQFIKEIQFSLINIDNLNEIVFFRILQVLKIVVF
jgi:hypothetical protein